MHFIEYLVLISAAEKPAVQRAMAAIGRSGLFETPVFLKTRTITRSSSTGKHMDGPLEAVPDAWMMKHIFKDWELTKVKSALRSIPKLRECEKNMKQPDRLEYDKRHNCDLVGMKLV